MRTPREQLDILRAVHAWRPKAFVFGGFAEDALLRSESTRPHDDVDVVVMRDDLMMRLDQARELGFDEVHVRLAVVPGKPLVVGCYQGELLLEFSVFDRDEKGDVYWEKPTPHGLARLYLPDDTFSWPESTLEGVPVRTVSPRALYQIRAGVIDTFEGMRPKDVVSQGALRERFFRDVPERALEPRVVPLARR